MVFIIWNTRIKRNMNRLSCSAYIGTYTEFDLSVMAYTPV